LHGGSGTLPFWGTLLPQKPKIGRIGAWQVDIGWACVDNSQFPSLTLLVFVPSCGQTIGDVEQQAAADKFPVGLQVG